MKLHSYLESLVASGGRPEPWDQTFTLAASDLTFLWRDCPRCFYLKVLMGVRRDATIPSVFTQMDREQRRFFDGTDPREIHSDLPAGRMICDETTILSVPLIVPGTNVSVRVGVGSEVRDDSVAPEREHGVDDRQRHERGSGALDRGKYR
jgi:hypothetical protein